MISRFIMPSARSRRSAFALPTVILISVAIIMILASLLAFVSARHRDSRTDYYLRLTEEAAEAGTALASGCLSLSERVQTWGPAASAPNLEPKTDCNGATAYTSNQYVFQSDTVRSRFVVGDLDYKLLHSVQISSRGIVEILNSAGTVIKTYESVQKKVMVWPTDFDGQISDSGTNRTCAVMSGAVYCWGYGAYGQLGNGRYLGEGGNGLEAANPGYDSNVPVKVLQQLGALAGKKIVKMFTAQHHTCALTSEGKMFCWGFNRSGQLGDGTQTDSAVPVPVGGALTGKTITEIGGTQDVSCAIADGNIYCWGSNTNGLAGDGSTNRVASPKIIWSTGGATKLASSGSRSTTMCAIISGKAYCWGQNAVGSVGDGTNSNNRLTPTKVLDTGVLAGKTVTSITQDGYLSTAWGANAHVCVVADSRVYCWGDNADGQLGDGSRTHRSAPVAIASGNALASRNVQDVKAGLRHTCALSNGAVYCWGNNGAGQVGDSTTTRRVTPVPVTQEPGRLTGSNVIAISAGANRSCAIITDGRSFCWGLNTSGQIGDGTFINRNRPTESLFLRPVGNRYIY